MKVGICWVGSAAHPSDRKRSTALQDWRPILTVTDCTFVSLQVGCTNERELFTQAGVTVTPCDTLNIQTFSDSARIVADLDLVISVDTAVVHLAGALNVPCWVLLPAAPDWRWMLRRTDSPWYASVRLFRQRRYMEWAPVIQEVAQALRQLVQANERKLAA